jgi:hypothetical protein
MSVRLLVLVSELYAPQTKILEGRTNLSECPFEALFNSRRQLIPILTNLPFHEFYPSQTKILEGVTTYEMQIFEALFKGESTSLGH